MPNLSYNRGRALEYKVRDHYQKEGYQVFRSAGSHSMADLICITSVDCGGDIYPEVVLVQCKTSSKLMTKKEKQDFRDYCETLVCRGVVAYRNKSRKLVLDNA